MNGEVSLAGTSGKLDELLRAWWPRLRPGGLLLVHSTLTNSLTRQWLEAMRARKSAGRGAADGEAEGDPLSGEDFETISLLEPHKRYQNSCSLFMRRPRGWGEPVHTTCP